LFEKVVAYDKLEFIPLVLSPLNAHDLVDVAVMILLVSVRTRELAFDRIMDHCCTPMVATVYRD
jgi:hypothetical protein